MSDSRLVNADGLLEAAFDKNTRPSLRWLREQTKKKALPFIRISGRVFFDVEQVRTVLAGRAVGLKRK
jgi:hypothetical protein